MFEFSPELKKKIAAAGPDADAWIAANTDASRPAMFYQMATGHAILEKLAAKLGMPEADLAALQEEGAFRVGRLNHLAKGLLAEAKGAARPTPAPTTPPAPRQAAAAPQAWTVDRLAAACDAAFGKGFSAALSETCTKAELQGRLERSLYFAGLTVPGMETTFAQIRAKYGDPQALQGLRRALAAGQQERLNRFLSTK